LNKNRRDGDVGVFLGHDSSLEGVLEFKGMARLDGVFRGSIRGSGTLMVGPKARIEADVTAACVIISGQVVGDVTATERLEIRAPGRLKGNINAPLVVMDEGVLFEGHCSMAGPESQIKDGKLTLVAAGT
jgi:cytoskeletal protein CcmA (bactofilin family)